MLTILNYATDILGSMNWFLISFLFTFSLTLFRRFKIIKYKIN